MKQLKWNNLTFESISKIISSNTSDNLTKNQFLASSFHVPMIDPTIFDNMVDRHLGYSYIVIKMIKRFDSNGQEIPR